MMQTLPLHWHQWGTGDRIALLLHGIATDATSFWRLAPLIAEQGYRVLAPDLRGHGLSPRAQEYTLEDFAADITPALGGHAVEVALGHSLGGAILGLLHVDLLPVRAIYVDPAWDVTQDSPETDASTFTVMARWDHHELAAAHPQWPADECSVELAALARWDTETAMGLHRQGRIFAVPATLEQPSLLVAADGSFLVPPARQQSLRKIGFSVLEAGTTDHAPYRVDPHRFVRLIKEWI